MPPQPGIPQQQGMRPPMPPHGIPLFTFILFSGFSECTHKTDLSEKCIAFKSTMLRLNLFFCVLNVFFRSVWWSSSRHARLSSWCYAAIWAGTANGAPLPRWASSTSDGNETSCNVARWPLLILLQSSLIGLEIKPFLNLCCLYSQASVNKASL